MSKPPKPRERLSDLLSFLIAVGSQGAELLARPRSLATGVTSAPSSALGASVEPDASLPAGARAQTLTAPRA